MSGSHSASARVVRRALIFLCFAALPAAAFFSAATFAQGRPMPMGESIRVKGKVTGLLPGMPAAVGMVTETGEQWAIQIDPRAREVGIQGSAESAFLRPGMFVEFRGVFDKRGVPQDPIAELKIFTPREDTQLGVLPVSASRVGSLTKSEKKSDKPATTAPFDVVGAIQSIDKNGELMIAAGAGLVRVKLADKVQITFELNDLRLTRPGDTVEATGWTYPMQEKMVLATRIMVTSAKPLGSAVEEAAKGDGKMPDLDSLDGF